MLAQRLLFAFFFDAMSERAEEDEDGKKVQIEQRIPQKTRLFPTRNSFNRHRLRFLNLLKRFLNKQRRQADKGGSLLRHNFLCCVVTSSEMCVGSFLSPEKKSQFNLILFSSML